MLDDKQETQKSDKEHQSEGDTNKQRDTEDTSSEESKVKQEQKQIAKRTKREQISWRYIQKKKQ